jgi:radical SAM protein with 4Fe4S-binding SPASM domain
MNDHLASKKKRYEDVISSNCFNKNLVGLATIEMNISEQCSRRCLFCPRFNPLVYRGEGVFMAIGTARSLALQCKLEDYVGDITIAGFGEPTMHPDIEKIIYTMSGNFTTLITNGDFLTQKLIERMVKAGLGKIVVSCYDGELARDNFHKLLSGCGIEYHVRELWGDFNKVVTENDFNSRTGLVPIVTNGSGQCYLPFYKLFIDWNGDVVLCSNDWHRKESGLGNINKDTVYDIWFGNKLTEIRKNLRDGNRCGKACKDCQVNGTLIGRESFELICPTISNT